MRAVVLFAAAAALASCSRAGDESAAKRSPLSPPPADVGLPEGLRVPVEVDGVEVEAVTAGRLAALAPDFSDDGRRAWRLTRVLADAFARPGATVEAVGTTGVAVVMARPASDEVAQPVLYLTRRGELAAAVVEPADPFPDYHGLGGRLRRPGDTSPRVLPVVRLRVRSGVTGAPGAAAGAGP